MALDEAEVGALQAKLVAAVGATVEGVERLTGGASRETYAVKASVGAESIRYIFQRETAEPRLPKGMASEAKLIQAARKAGVPAPRVVATNGEIPETAPVESGEGLRGSFLVTEAVEGETIARKILREPRYEHARQVLPAQLGTALAKLHTGVESRSVPWLEAEDQLQRYKDALDEIGLISPAFEMAFRWLDVNRPDAGPMAVVHGDFRLGNFVVDQNGLVAVLDWELGHLGDPMEDLGWLCVRAWRFGGQAPVAGLGNYDALFDAYHEAGGARVDPKVVKYWEVVGTLKWGIMCALQAERHLSGNYVSVELAAIGARVAEQEYDVLHLITPEALRSSPTSISKASGVTSHSNEHARRLAKNDRDTTVATGGANGGGGRPTTAELLFAVESFLRSEVLDATTGQTSFHARVAANVLGIVQRDLAAGASATALRDSAVGALGYANERALCDALRFGEIDIESKAWNDCWSAMAEAVDARVAINNPKWAK